ncbi:efflux RND transporter periplasmic adaptor subunit [Phytopseudomonas dryadis]|uniref:Efflux transporter periplasmic adaptor subunit n=1 Tax=Phytopseudomonas dryadis TaxID=2487520 RepID=A0A4Q9QVC5_9GAMM|nr:MULTISPECIES: efflux RND transporter periplasmic adaptor subunit [Pseudomonas]TBU86548.1 efflux transporter periplasmic adaptor subunit [Pseudomonas dryadis]TBV07254.1 efflux transporter periplasmic adaptor subunit [Pseudomonas dryadis]TBV17881.1 efflux transporter periplasmic adaptor subunit [Pseudomonas sp. FRB 230]
MLLRRMLIMLGIVVLAIIALAAYKGLSIYRQIQQFSAPQPAISVAAATAEERPWQGRLPAIGTLKAFKGVDLTVEVGGTVSRMLFDSGEKVALQQPLLQMDSAVEQANLATAEAELGLARVEFERGRSLVSRSNISKSEFDRLAAELQKSNASVAQLKALLAKKRILAPFAGTIGIRQVEVGDYLASGTTIATLQDLSTLFVDFFLPEQNVPQLAVGQVVRLGVSAYPGELFEGRVAAINPKVENTTRNVQVRATLANPGEKLLPGMFANLEVLLPGAPRHIVVPETAITYTLYGNSVYVIAAQQDDQGQPLKDEQGQAQLGVKRRFVETGERRDGLAVILAGLRAGEQVVSAGQLKLDNGAHVTIVDEPVDGNGQSDAAR